MPSETTYSFFVHDMYFGSLENLSEEKKYLQFIKLNWLGYITTFVIVWHRAQEHGVWSQTGLVSNTNSVTYKLYDLG